MGPKELVTRALGALFLALLPLAAAADVLMPPPRSDGVHLYFPGNAPGVWYPERMPAFAGGDCVSTQGTVSLTCAPFARLGSANTYTGKQTYAASTASGAPVNVPPGTAPTAPVDGDIWVTSAGLFVRASGVTLGPFTSTAATSPQPGFRNRLINADDRIDVRNGGAAQTIGGAYTDDRWIVTASGATVTGQQVAGGTNATPVMNRYQLTGNSGVTAVQRCQRIAASNSADMAGQTATLSVDLSDSLLTSVGWTVSRATSLDNFSGAVTVGSGSFTVSGTLARYSAPVTLPTSATLGLQVCFSVGAQVSGTWLIGASQFELGTVASPFEVRPLSVELEMAQRYYEVGTAASVTYNGGAATVKASPVFFKVRKRAAPTVTLSSPTNSNSSGPTVANATPSLVEVNLGVSAAGVAYSSFTYAADAEL